MGMVEANWSIQGSYRLFLLVSTASIIEASHSLIAASSTDWVRATCATRGRHGHRRTEEEERAATVTALRHLRGVLAVKLSPRTTENLGPEPWQLWLGGGRQTGEVERRWNVGSRFFHEVLRKCKRHQRCW